MKPQDITVEHLTETIGIGTPAPRLSWVSEGAQQSAYEIEVRYDDGDVATSGRVPDSDSRLRSWPGRPLRSRQRAHVRVRLWSAEADAAGPWSDTVPIEAGLLDESDWTVDWWSPSESAPVEAPRPAYLLRAAFQASGEVRRARLYATAHGVHELEVNGSRISDEILAPGWSSYRHRIRYRTHDVTSRIEHGDNAVGVWLADGWYRGRLGFNGGVWNNYGDDVAALVQLEIEDDHGTRVVPLQWAWAPSPITATGLYEGETHDERRSEPGWSTADFDASAWEAATALPRGRFSGAIEAPTGPPVRVVDVLAPTEITTRPDGRILVDFGQNISGKLRIAGRDAGGATIELHHAEVLEGGELCVRPLRSATSVDRYIPADDEPFLWTPRFTLHGFRYAEIRGIPADAVIESIEALVVHSDMTRTGWFSSSNPLLDRFHQNVVWSMRDNFVDLPTDCPQRDERLGWSGDIQVFAPAATYLYDCTGVLQNWLRDLAAEQLEFRSVMNFHPWIECGFPSDPAAAWGDAAVIVPWALYQRTGDLEILRDQFPSMRAWVEQVHDLTGGTGHWSKGFQLGDWLDPAAPPDRPGDSRTDPRLVATAYHARTAQIVAQAAELIGENAAERAMRTVANRAREAFRSYYVSPAGLIVSDTVAALSVAITFDLLDDERQRRNAGARLAELVREGDHLIQTGFVGTPIVCDALTSTGHIDTAYHLLLRDEAPSWLYPVTMGATTVWERWDSLLPDGSVNPGEMTSFNHYALGAVVDFVHRVVGGLECIEPGWRRVRVAPRPGGGLTHASTSQRTPYGLATVSWERHGTTLVVNVDLPPGVTGEIVLPSSGGRVIEVGAGQHEFTCSFREPEADPPRPRRWNIHNPEERLQMIEAGVL